VEDNRTINLDFGSKIATLVAVKKGPTSLAVTAKFVYNFAPFVSASRIFSAPIEIQVVT
jgi:hypothetical protein